MAIDPIALQFSNALLGRFELCVCKLDNRPRLHIDQMVVLLSGRDLVARATIADVVADDQVRVFWNIEVAVDGRQRYSGIAPARCHIK